MAKLKDTVVDGNIELTGDITLQNKMSINGIDTDGNSRENFQPCNHNNNCIVGYGNYSTDNGNTHIYGVAVNTYTKDNDVTVDGIQIGRTDKSVITSLSSGWVDYGTGTSPTVRRWGKVISLTGALKNSAAVTLNTNHIKVFTIPTGFRPSQDILVLCQGSGSNEFLMQVKANGEVYFGRYSNTTSFSEVSSGSWFPFHVTWVVD